MRIVRRAVGMLILILLLAAGLLLLFAATAPGYWANALALGDTLQRSVAWMGAVLVLGGILFALCEYRSRRRERFLSFENDGGTVSVSTVAMADYIAKLAVEFPSVVRLRPVIKPRRNAVDILVELRVKAGSQVHEVCELLQQRIRESVVDGLGITEVRRIEVSVREIVSEHRPA